MSFNSTRNNQYDYVNVSPRVFQSPNVQHGARMYDYRGGYFPPAAPYCSTQDLTIHGRPPPHAVYHNTSGPWTPARSPRPQVYQSQQRLAVACADQSRRHKTPNVSSIEVSRLKKPNPSRPEQPPKSSAHLLERPLPSFLNGCPIVQTMVQSAAVCDRAAARLNNVLAWLDDEDRNMELADREKNRRRVAIDRDNTEPPERPHGSTIDFKKTWHYANSRLPPQMPPMNMYMATWQIVCMAAQTSLDVYRRTKKEGQEDYVKADWRQGTKAMIINSRPVDDRNLIVIAIRGSKWNVVDWAVNFRPAPSEPIGFLDDQGNACHSGFLQVARAMVAPIAARLRNMLEQNPSRASSSLLFTGHSAGGAVASLLYMHMMATTFESELNILAGCFKRIHCVTFGTPPLTLLPLQNPAGKRYERNVFMSFANEGDPVVRADRQYLSTLTRIIAAPSPLSEASLKLRLKQGQTSTAGLLPPRCEVPPATLSNAGRMILLRDRPGQKAVIEAVQVTDQQLREVIFGDPEMHRMELYKRRIDALAVAAVTGSRSG